MKWFYCCVVRLEECAYHITATESHLCCTNIFICLSQVNTSARRKIRFNICYLSIAGIERSGNIWFEIWFDFYWWTTHSTAVKRSEYEIFFLQYCVFKLFTICYVWYCLRLRLRLRLNPLQLPYKYNGSVHIEYCRWSSKTIHKVIWWIKIEHPTRPNTNFK